MGRVGDLIDIAIAAGVALALALAPLGRLVTEPLPVVVRASETQEGRARLYRSVPRPRSRGRGHVRTGAACAGSAARLDVPTGDHPEVVAGLVAGRDSGGPVTTSTTPCCRTVRRRTTRRWSGWPRGWTPSRRRSRASRDRRCGPAGNRRTERCTAT